MLIQLRDNAIKTQGHRDARGLAMTGTYPIKRTSAEPVAFMWGLSRMHIPTVSKLSSLPLCEIRRCA